MLTSGPHLFILRPAFLHIPFLQKYATNLTAFFFSVIKIPFSLAVQSVSPAGGRCFWPCHFVSVSCSLSLSSSAVLPLSIFLFCYFSPTHSLLSSLLSLMLVCMHLRRIAVLTSSPLVHVEVECSSIEILYYFWRALPGDLMTHLANSYSRMIDWDS